MATDKPRPEQGVAGIRPHTQESVTVFDNPGNGGEGDNAIAALHYLEKRSMAAFSRLLATPSANSDFENAELGYASIAKPVALRVDCVT